MGVLPLYREAVGVFYSPSQLGKWHNGNNGHCNLIYNIILRLKKENVHLFLCPWGYNYTDVYLQSSWEDMALEVTVSSVKSTDVTYNLPWLVNLASLVCDVDWWLSGRVSVLHYVVAGLISTGGDHSIHCWWDLIWLKQLSSGSVCRAQVFVGFSGDDNSIYNISCKVSDRSRGRLEGSLFNCYYTEV